MLDEDRLDIPSSWHPYLDGRPGGRMSDERARQILYDPYATLESESYDSIQRDSVAAPYALVALHGAGALSMLAEDGTPTFYDGAVAPAVAEAISVIPTDAALEALLAGLLSSVMGLNTSRMFGPAFQAACERFPRRAVRVLAARAVGTDAAAKRCRGLLEARLRAAPEEARAVLDALEPAARALVESLLEGTSAPMASEDAWPEVLRAPPWIVAPKRKKPKKLSVEPLPVPARTVWRPGERARWAAMPNSAVVKGVAREVEARGGWEKLLADPRPVGGLLPLLLAGPEPLVRPYAREHTPAERDLRWSMPTLFGVVARLERDALGMALAAAQGSPKDGYELLLPFGTAEVAERIAFGLAKHKSVEEVAVRWLCRHGEVAALALIPRALAGDKPAIKALMRCDRPAVETVAARYGDAAREALAQRLADARLDLVPRKLPTPAVLVDPASLPPPVLRVGGALSAEGVERLAIMLAFSKPGVPFDGIAEVAAACTPASIQRFSWALFEAWLNAGAPPKERWAFLQLGWLGDDTLAERLASLMERWPREGAAKRAEQGLDVLTEMPGDLSLVLVQRMAEKAKSRSLRRNAQTKLHQLADRLGLLEDDLADRIAPRFGLDDDATLTLTEGERTFRVGFDAALSPFACDEHGKRLEDLPKGDARKRFVALKKGARTAIASERRRLERAMTSGRRWSARDFQRFVLAHPILVRLAAPLVWARFEGSALVEAFRVRLEDRALVNLAGERVTLADDASVGVAHPLELGEQREAWRVALASEPVPAPFSQLDRQVFEVEDRAALLTDLLEDQVAPGPIMGLTSRGWEQGERGDHGAFYLVRRILPGEVLAELTFEPGIVHAGQDGSQDLGELRLSSGAAPVEVDALSAVAFSELIRDLSTLA